jgi:signal transduction histidine kinase
VTNLLLNSLDAIASSGVGGQVLLGAQVVPDAVEVSVEDDGPGWPSSDADAPQSRGSGLGLIIVRAIVESRHGTMRLEKSKRLGGARVLVRLPSW